MFYSGRIVGRFIESERNCICMLVYNFRCLHSQCYQSSHLRFLCIQRKRLPSPPLCSRPPRQAPVLPSDAAGPCAPVCRGRHLCSQPRSPVHVQCGSGCRTLFPRSVREAMVWARATMARTTMVFKESGAPCQIIFGTRPCAPPLQRVHVTKENGDKGVDGAPHCPCSTPT